MPLYFNIDRWEHLSEDEKEDLKILSRLFDADNEEQLIVLYKVLRQQEPESNPQLANKKQIFQISSV